MTTRGGLALLVLTVGSACSSTRATPAASRVESGASGAASQRGAADHGDGGMDSGIPLGAPNECGREAPGRVCLPTGVSQLGRAAPETRFEERPPRGARLRSFAIDVDEVSAASYARCVARGTCRAARCDDGTAPPADGPARCVAWADARAYCTDAGGRLPSEAQWERAAAGLLPGHRSYPWGELELDGGATERPADITPEGVRAMGGGVAEWAAEAGAFYPSAVRPDAGVRDGAVDATTAARPPSAPSAIDLSENDSADAGPEFTEAGVVIVDDPRGPADGPWRVVRGGDDAAPLVDWTSTRRRFRLPGDRRAWIGFRCAYVPSAD